MPVPTLNGLPPWSTIDDVKNKINDITGEINNLLVSLDTLNIIELNAKVITAGSIQTDKLAAGSITTDKIQAGAVTADKITVGQLSAIAADLGHITAGLIESIQIYSSYFGTRNGIFPLCEIDSSNNRIRSAYSDTDYISMEPAFGGAPILFLTTSLNDTLLTSDADRAYFQTNKELKISSDTGSILIVTDFGNTEFQDFYKIYDQSTSESLQQKLDNINSTLSVLSSEIASLDARVTALESP